MTDLETRAARHAALADVTRLAVVDLLALQDASPREIAERLGLGSNLLAHHLAVLERAGLVERRRSEADRRRSASERRRSTSPARSSTARWWASRLEPRPRRSAISRGEASWSASRSTTASRVTSASAAWRAARVSRSVTGPTLSLNSY